MVWWLTGVGGWGAQVLVADPGSFLFPSFRIRPQGGALCTVTAIYRLDPERACPARHAEGEAAVAAFLQVPQPPRPPFREILAGTLTC